MRPCLKINKHKDSDRNQIQGREEREEGGGVEGREKEEGRKERNIEKIAPLRVRVVGH